MLNEREYRLDIQGYYSDDVRSRFPHSPGIYFVYRGVLDSAANTCTLRQLLYIGQTEDLHQRHNEHSMRDEFLETVGSDEMLFYTFSITDLPAEDRMRIEAALIYELKPALNSQNCYTFNYPPTRVVVEGNRHAFVPASIDAPSY